MAYSDYSHTEGSNHAFGAGALIAMASRGMLDSHVTGDDAESHTIFKKMFVKSTASCPNYVTHKVSSNYGQTDQIKLQKMTDMIQDVFIEATLPGLHVTRDPNGSTGQPTNRQSLPVNNSCNSEDIKIKLDELGCKVDDSIHAKWTKGCELTVSDLEAINEAYAQLTGLRGDCSAEDACACNRQFLDGMYATYSNGVAFCLMESVSITIGNQRMDTIQSEYAYMKSEFLGKNACLSDQMCGLYETKPELACASAVQQQIIYTVPFWFSENGAHNALPVCALQFHDCIITCESRRIHDLVSVSRSDVVVDTCNNCLDKTLSYQLTCLGWYLDNSERQMVSSQQAEILVSVSQKQVMQCTAGQSLVSMPFNFNLGITSLFIAARSDMNTNKNNYLDFGGFNNLEAIKNIKITLNNASYFDSTSFFARTATAIGFAPNSFARSYTYLVPMANTAIVHGDQQCTGILNMSRIDNAQGEFKMETRFSHFRYSIFVHANTINVASIKSGMMGMNFAS